MNSPSDPIPQAGWLEDILAQPDRYQQQILLDQAGWLNAAGLSDLLDQAAVLARRHPGQAQKLTEICAFFAHQVEAPALAARADYVRAQTHAMNGEMDAALALIEQAQAGYSAAGEQLEALRANLGKMHVFNEMGRHIEALQAGRAILDGLDMAVLETNPQARMMVALAHMNQGICFETLGRYDEALASYQEAQAEFQQLDAPDRLADVLNNQGIVLTHLGKARPALEALNKASLIYAQHDLRLRQAQALNNTGDAHLLLGEYALALNAFEQARDILDDMEAQAVLSITLRKTADAYLALNLFPEAISAYREAIALIEQAGLHDHLGRALAGLGTALAAEKNWPEALTAFERSGQVFEQAQNIPMTATIWLERSAIHSHTGQQAAAQETARQAMRVLEARDGEAWPVQRLHANLRLADALMTEPEAEACLLQAQAILDRLGLPALAVQVYGRLGHWRLQQQRLDEAEHSLLQARGRIEELRGQVSVAGRLGFFRDKAQVFEDLLSLYLQRGDHQAAFATAEAARARSLADLLRQAQTPEAEPAGKTRPDALEKDARRLAGELNALYMRLLQPEESTLPAQRQALLQRAQDLEQALNRIRLRQEGRSGLVDPQTPSLNADEVAAALPPAAALLSFALVDGEALAFVLRPGQALQVVHGLGHSDSLRGLLHKLALQWDRMHVGGDFLQRNLDVMEQTTRRILNELYQLILAPLESCLAGVERLAIAPFDLLHRVPFHALWDGNAYLAERFEIVYTFSGTVYAANQRRAPAAGLPGAQQALVIGAADALIPWAEIEAQQVADLLTQAGWLVDLRQGRRARRLEMRNALRQAGLVHLACHGIFRADNPMYSALKLPEGWLTAAEIQSAGLPGSLVALSACESGRSLVVEGEEAIGLPRAFLGAGASAVLVSQWVVDDESAGKLMTAFYQTLLQGHLPETALRQAQAALRQERPHPYYWAPFVVMR